MVDQWRRFLESDEESDDSHLACMRQQEQAAGGKGDGGQGGLGKGGKGDTETFEIYSALKGKACERLRQIMKGKGHDEFANEIANENSDEIANACIQHAKCGMSRDVGWWFLGKMSAKGIGKGIDKVSASSSDLTWYAKGASEGTGKERMHRIVEGKGFGYDPIQTTQEEWGEVCELIIDIMHRGIDPVVACDPLFPAFKAQSKALRERRAAESSNSRVASDGAAPHFESVNLPSAQLEALSSIQYR